MSPNDSAERKTIIFGRHLSKQEWRELRADAARKGVPIGELIAQIVKVHLAIVGKE